MLALNLYGKTMLVLWSQLLIVVLVVLVWYHQQRHNKKKPQRNGRMIWIFFLLQLLCLFLIMANRQSILLSFLFFTLFSILTGLMVAPSVLRDGRATVITALASTACIFLVMSLLGFYLSSHQLFWFRTPPWKQILWISLLALLLGLLLQWILVLCGVHIPGFYRLLCLLGIILFSVYLVFDTQTILLAPQETNPVLHAVNLFLDLINLFQFQS